MSEKKQGPLSGIKILDFTRVYAGPYCTMLLADLGAETIKVEIPKIGDDSRRFLPIKNNESGYYMYLNRNKKGITLDLKTAKGKKIAIELARWADILVENFSPGTMDNLGLSYSNIKRINPQIIYASISGFGQTGPLRNKVAYDPVAQAMGGLMAVTGYPDRPPVKVGSSIADANAGIHGAFGILAALYHRIKTGQGQHVDVSMMDAVFSILENHIVQYTLLGINPQRIGNDSLTSAPFGTFETKDDYVVIATANDKLFHKLAHAMERDDLITDERFITNADRVRNYDELKPMVEEWTRQYITTEIVERLDKQKIPVAPILPIEQLVKHPQVKAREMLSEIDHPVAGKFSIPNIPIKFSETPGSIRTSSPLLGQHTDEILTTILGMTVDDVNKLRKEGVI